MAYTKARYSTNLKKKRCVQEMSSTKDLCLPRNRVTFSYIEKFPSHKVFNSRQSWKIFRLLSQKIPSLFIFHRNEMQIFPPGVFSYSHLMLSRGPKEIPPRFSTIVPRPIPPTGILFIREKMEKKKRKENKVLQKRGSIR